MKNKAELMRGKWAGKLYLALQIFMINYKIECETALSGGRMPCKRGSPPPSSELLSVIQASGRGRRARTTAQAHCDAAASATSPGEDGVRAAVV